MQNHRGPFRSLVVGAYGRIDIVRRQVVARGAMRRRDSVYRPNTDGRQARNVDTRGPRRLARYRSLLDDVTLGQSPFRYTPPRAAYETPGFTMRQQNLCRKGCGGRYLRKQGRAADMRRTSRNGRPIIVKKAHSHMADTPPIVRFWSRRPLKPTANRN